MASHRILIAWTSRYKSKSGKKKKKKSKAYPKESSDNQKIDGLQCSVTKEYRFEVSLRPKHLKWHCFTAARPQKLKKKRKFDRNQGKNEVHGENSVVYSVKVEKFKP